MSNPIENCYDALIEAIAHMKTHSSYVNVSPKVWKEFNQPKIVELKTEIQSHTTDKLHSNEQHSMTHDHFSHKEKNSDIQPPAPAEILHEDINSLIDTILHCQRCELCKKCTQPIAGMGGHHADIMWIGDVPTESDDKVHALLQGNAGALLSKMIAAMQLPESNHYITTIIKCFPGRNTPPAQVHVDACLDYLHRQIKQIRPKVIILMGYTTVLHTIKGNVPKSDAMVGKWLELDGIPAMPIYSPAFLARLEQGRDPAVLREKKMQTWVALQEIMHYLATN